MRCKHNGNNSSYIISVLFIISIIFSLSAPIYAISLQFKNSTKKHFDVLITPPAGWAKADSGYYYGAGYKGSDPRNPVYILDTSDAPTDCNKLDVTIVLGSGSATGSFDLCNTAETIFYAKAYDISPNRTVHLTTTYTRGQIFHLRILPNWFSAVGTSTPFSYAANVSTSTIADTTPPETAITSGPGNNSIINSAAVAFTYTGTDNYSMQTNLRYQYRFDGGAWSALSKTANVSYTYLPNGQHLFEVVAVDEAGNVDPTPASRTFTISCPDLRVTDVHSSATVNAGQSLSVTYSIQNNGSAIAGKVWNDTIYLSKTNDLSGITSTLGSISNSMVLPGGQNYVKTQSFIVPSTLSGNFYVVVKTDSSDALSEGDKDKRFGATLTPVNVTAAGHLWLKFNVPPFVRQGRNVAGYIIYGNDGQQDLPAPILMLTQKVLGGSDSAPIYVRLSQNDPYQKPPFQIIGTGNSQSAPGVLKPGDTKTIPFYFSTSNSPYYHFALQQLIVDGSAVDWSSIESQVKPSDIDPQAWSVIWNNFKTQLGSTWQAYSNTITADALYFASHNNPTQDIQRIFSFEIDKAGGVMCPQKLLASSLDAKGEEPGLSLSFTRFAPVAIAKRYRVGSFGRGWYNSWEYSLVSVDSSHVVIKGPGGLDRLFINEDSKGWKGKAGDYGSLSHNKDNTWTLVDKGLLTISFSPTGVLTSITDSHGNALLPQYNNGNIVEIDHTNGDKILIGYNTIGRITSVTDPVGRTTTYSYNDAGDTLISVTAPDGRKTSYSYATPTGSAADYALSTITYPDGSHLYYQYDSYGRLAGHCMDNSALQVGYSISGVGVLQITDAAGNISTIDYGINGVPLTIRDNTGRSVPMQFDDCGNVVKMTSPDGAQSSIQYDTRSNPISITDPLGGVTLLESNSTFDFLSLLKDTYGAKTSYQYNAAGDDTTILYPNGTNHHFEFDNFGNLTKAINRSGIAVSFTYDNNGRMLTKTYSDGRIITYTYDIHGNLTSAADTLTGTVSMVYDTHDYVTSITYPNDRSLSFVYDTAGRRTKRISDTGTIISYNYDYLGRLFQVGNGNGYLYALYSYDILGRVSRIDKGNGTYTTYGYDYAGRITDIYNYSNTGSVISRFSYQFDTNGNRTKLTTINGITQYGYDICGQLTGVILPNGRTITYKYDKLGNRIMATDNGAATTYAVNILNQYSQAGAATCDYDSNGNLISKTFNDGSQIIYGYDEDNRLISITAPGDKWLYSYGALGNKYIVTHNGVTTYRIIDPIDIGDLAGEFEAGGAIIAQYVHGGSLVGRIAADNSVAYYNFDGSGNTSELTNANNNIVNSYQYLPFGELLNQTENITNPFKYVGEFGVEQDNFYTIWMRNRDYDSGVGRFIQPDPLDLLGEDINLYRYSSNNPVGYIDPLGLDMASTLKKIENDPRGFIKDLINSIKNGTDVANKNASVEKRVDAGMNILSNVVSETPTGTITVKAGQQYNHAIHSIYDPTTNYLSALNESMAKGTEPPQVNDLSVRQLVVTGKILNGSKFDSEDKNTIIETMNNYAKSHPIMGGIINNIIGITSHDPNEMQGPVGYGDNHAIVSSQPMTYTIYFENASTATAPAQIVNIDDILDPSLDPTTLSLGEVAFGKQVVIDLNGLNSGTATVPLNDSPYKVAIVQTSNGNKLHWTLTCFDPSGNELPGQAGFLPPNDNTGKGEGHVTFTVSPRSPVANGTVISNMATIVFDENAPIDTNVYTNVFGSPLTDQLIKIPTESSYSGGNIYAATTTIPSSQVKTQQVNTGQIAAYNLELANSGSVAGNYIITGPSSASGWMIKYYDAASGGNDITNAITTSGWSVSLDPGAVQEYRVEISPDTTVPPGSAKKVLIRAVLDGDTSLSDTVETLTYNGVPPAANGVSFAVITPAYAVKGVPVSVTIDALDQYGNVAPNYTGNIQLTTSDSSASIGSSTPFIIGEGKGTITFNSNGAFTITATDTANTVMTGISNPVTVINPPATMLTLTGTLGNTPWYTSDVTAVISSSSGSLPVGSIMYCIDGGSAQQYKSPFKISGEGTHTVEYWSVDSAGNSEAHHSQSVSIDTTVPISTATVTGANVAIAASDTTSGVAATYYSIDDSPKQVYSTSFTVNTLGNHAISFYSMDKAGNSETPKTINLTVSVPVTKISLSGTMKHDPWYIGSVIVSLNASGSLPVKTTYYTIDGSEQLAYSEPFAIVNDGAHTVVYWSVDIYGNAEAPNAQNIVIDRTPPLSSGSISGADITLSASDNLSGVVATYYTVDSGIQQTYTAPFSVTSPGSHIVSFYSIDKAGNIEKPKSLSLDISLPITQLTLNGSKGNNPWYLSSVQATLSASGSLPINGSYYTIDGNTQQPYSAPFDINDDGIHIIVYWSVDSSGNQETPNSQTINIDTTSPITTEAGIANGSSVFGNVTITLSAVDNLSGISATYYTIDDGGAQQAYSSSITVSSNGSHTITYWSVDKAGNRETATSVSFTIKPSPSITSLSPSSVAGASTFTLTVNGSNFVSGSIIKWNGTNMTTTYVSPTQLTASINKYYTTLSSYPGSATVSVLNPDGGRSSGATISITQPVTPPTITSLSPSSVTGATTFTLTVNGTNFVSGSIIKWNGTNMTTTCVSATKLTASINKYYTTLTSYPGSATISVLNPDGNRSTNATLTITAPLPVISSLSPASVQGATTFTLTVNGSNFVSGSIIKWNGTNMSTTFVSSTQLTASINKYYDTLTSYPGSATVTILNPDGGRSTSATIAITQPITPPTITSLSPSSITGATNFTLTVNGAGFQSGAVIKWNGTNMTTTFVSSTQLTASIGKYYDTLSSYPGSATVSVLNPDSGRSAGTTLAITQP